MNLAHAIVHHPLKDERVWGVRIRQIVNLPDSPGSYSYATGYSSYSFGRIPQPGMTLRDAVDAYVSACTTWNTVQLYRNIPVQGSGDLIQVMDDDCLRHPGYTEHLLKGDERVHRLIIKGAKLPPEIYAKYVAEASNRSFADGL